MSVFIYGQESAHMIQLSICTVCIHGTDENIYTICYIHSVQLGVHTVCTVHIYSYFIKDSLL